MRLTHNLKLIRGMVILVMGCCSKVAHCKSGGGNRAVDNTGRSTDGDGDSSDGMLLSTKYLYYKLVIGIKIWESFYL